MKSKFAPGDRVVRKDMLILERYKSKGFDFDTVGGKVLSVFRKTVPTGGSRYRVRVEWNNGYRGTVEETQLFLVLRPRAKDG